MRSTNPTTHTTDFMPAPGYMRPLLDQVCEEGFAVDSHCVRHSTSPSAARFVELAGAANVLHIDHFTVSANTHHLAPHYSSRVDRWNTPARLADVIVARPDHALVRVRAAHPYFTALWAMSGQARDTSDVDPLVGAVRRISEDTSMHERDVRSWLEEYLTRNIVASTQAHLLEEVTAATRKHYPMLAAYVDELRSSSHGAGPAHRALADATFALFTHAFKIVQLASGRHAMRPVYLDDSQLVFEATPGVAGELATYLGERLKPSGTIPLRLEVSQPLSRLCDAGR